MINLSILLEKSRSVHFVGIGGVGMSGLALLLCEKGYLVTGTDLVSSSYTSKLQKKGVSVFLGLQKTIPVAADLIIVSSAISETDPQLVLAKELNIPIFHRSKLLDYFLDSDNSTGITGMHGKTTTTSIVSFLAEEVGLDPTFIVGGTIMNYGTNAKLGKSEYVFAELDESDKSLLNVSVKNAVITNIEEEHLDVYSGLSEIKSTMLSFINSLPVDGNLIYNLDDNYLPSLVSDVNCKKVSFSIVNPSASLYASEIICDDTGISFDLHINGKFFSSFLSTLAGNHNVSNILAALSLFFSEGINLTDFVDILPLFKGAARRSEIIYENENYTLIDDYAHHPTEIEAIVESLLPRKGEKELVIVFQPHRYSRVLHFGDSFAKAFIGADYLFITDIYNASETEIDNVDNLTLYNKIEHSSFKVVKYLEREFLVKLLQDVLPAKAIIVFCGAGDIIGVSDEFKSILKKNSVNR